MPLIGLQAPKKVILRKRGEKVFHDQKVKLLISSCICFSFILTSLSLSLLLAEKWMDYAFAQKVSKQ